MLSDVRYLRNQITERITRTILICTLQNDFSQNTALIHHPVTKSVEYVIALVTLLSMTILSPANTGDFFNQNFAISH